MEERVFFNEDGVSVSNARFVVNGQTYAMNAVTSVKQTVNPPSRTAPVFLALVGLVIFAAGFQHDESARLATSFNQAFAMVFGIALMAFAIYWGYLQKAEYIVVLQTSSGESQALKSTDRAYVESIIGALNQSIVHRG